VHIYKIQFQGEKWICIIYLINKKRRKFYQFLELKNIKDQILCQKARIKIFDSSLIRKNMFTNEHLIHQKKMVSWMMFSWCWILKVICSLSLGAPIGFWIIYSIKFNIEVMVFQRRGVFHLQYILTTPTPPNICTFIAC